MNGTLAGVQDMFKKLFANPSERGSTDTSGQGFGTPEKRFNYTDILRGGNIRPYSRQQFNN